MANGFLAPFFTGALGEYSRQEVENDKIISKIIDNVSNKVLNQEEITGVQNYIENKYGEPPY